MIDNEYENQGGGGGGGGAGLTRNYIYLGSTTYFDYDKNLQPLYLKRDKNTGKQIDFGIEIGFGKITQRIKSIYEWIFNCISLSQKDTDLLIRRINRKYHQSLFNIFTTTGTHFKGMTQGKPTSDRLLLYRKFLNRIETYSSNEKLSLILFPFWIRLSMDDGIRKLYDLKNNIQTNEIIRKKILLLPTILYIWYNYMIVLLKDLNCFELYENKSRELGDKRRWDYNPITKNEFMKLEEKQMKVIDKLMHLFLIFQLYQYRQYLSLSNDSLQFPLLKRIMNTSILTRLQPQILPLMYNNLNNNYSQLRQTFIEGLDKQTFQLHNTKLLHDYKGINDLIRIKNELEYLLNKQNGIIESKLLFDSSIKEIPTRESIFDRLINPKEDEGDEFTERKNDDEVVPSSFGHYDEPDTQKENKIKDNRYGHSDVNHILFCIRFANQEASKIVNQVIPYEAMQPSFRTVAERTKYFSNRAKTADEYYKNPEILYNESIQIGIKYDIISDEEHGKSLLYSLDLKLTKELYGTDVRNNNYLVDQLYRRTLLHIYLFIMIIERIRRREIWYWLHPDNPHWMNYPLDWNAIYIEGQESFKTNEHLGTSTILPILIYLIFSFKRYLNDSINPQIPFYRDLDEIERILVKCYQSLSIDKINILFADGIIKYNTSKDYITSIDWSSNQKLLTKLIASTTFPLTTKNNGLRKLLYNINVKEEEEKEEEVKEREEKKQDEEEEEEKEVYDFTEEKEIDPRRQALSKQRIPLRWIDVNNETKKRAIETQKEKDELKEWGEDKSEEDYPVFRHLLYNLMYTRTFLDYRIFINIDEQQMELWYNYIQVWLEGQYLLSYVNNLIIKNQLLNRERIAFLFSTTTPMIGNLHLNWIVSLRELLNMFERWYNYNFRPLISEKEELQWDSHLQLEKQDFGLLLEDEHYQEDGPVEQEEEVVINTDTPIDVINMVNSLVSEFFLSENNGFDLMFKKRQAVKNYKPLPEIFFTVFNSLLVWGEIYILSVICNKWVLVTMNDLIQNENEMNYTTFQSYLDTYVETEGMIITPFTQQNLNFSQLEQLIINNANGGKDPKEQAKEMFDVFKLFILNQKQATIYKLLEKLRDELLITLEEIEKAFQVQWSPDITLMSITIPEDTSTYINIFNEFKTTAEQEFTVYYQPYHIQKFNIIPYKDSLYTFYYHSLIETEEKEPDRILNALTNEFQIYEAKSHDWDEKTEDVIKTLINNANFNKEERNKRILLLESLIEETLHCSDETISWIYLIEEDRMTSITKRNKPPKPDIISYWDNLKGFDDEQARELAKEGNSDEYKEIVYLNTHPEEEEKLIQTDNERRKRKKELTVDEKVKNELLTRLGEEIPEPIILTNLKQDDAEDYMIISDESDSDVITSNNKKRRLAGKIGHHTYRNLYFSMRNHPSFIRLMKGTHSISTSLKEYCLELLYHLRRCESLMCKLLLNKNHDIKIWCLLIVAWEWLFYDILIKRIDPILKSPESGTRDLPPSLTDIMNKPKTKQLWLKRITIKLNQYLFLTHTVQEIHCCNGRKLYYLCYLLSKRLNKYETTHSDHDDSPFIHHKIIQIKQRLKQLMKVIQPPTTHNEDYYVPFSYYYVFLFLLNSCSHLS